MASSSLTNIDDDFESHGECVTALPPGSQCLAKSGTAAVEMWRYGSNVLAFQYHPELHPLMALEKIHPTMSSIGRLDEAEQLVTLACSIEGCCILISAVPLRLTSSAVSYVT
eukprot:1160793-Pelagomonas_calceolata.AAC.4